MRARLAGLILFFLVAVAAASALWLRRELGTPFYGSAEPETFVEIPRGAGTATIARLLTDARVLNQSLPFELYIRWTGRGRSLQAGEYRFASPATPTEVAERLLRGDVYFHSLTVPEGLTAAETVALVAAAGVGERSEFERALRRVEWIRDLSTEARNLEGYLFPDTYRVSRGARSEEVIRIMVDRFRERFAALARTTPAPPHWSVHRLVTLASMVEKEVKNAEERPLVASVLANRLAAGMPLACDPTIIYALKLAGRWDGNLRKADLSLDSPYNSYLRGGLPPTPIANPGAASLRAALAPAKTDYLYFVARNDGTHEFSRNYRTHQAAVSRFQRRTTP